MHSTARPSAGAYTHSLLCPCTGTQRQGAPESAFGQANLSGLQCPGALGLFSSAAASFSSWLLLCECESFFLEFLFFRPCRDTDVVGS